MDKRVDLSEKMSLENNAENQESNREIFVDKVASSALVLKFKMDKYGTLKSTHNISSQEEMISGAKQNVRELLDNSEANTSPNAIPLLEQSEINAAEATRGNKISLFDNVKAVPTDEIVNRCDECGKCCKEISSLHGHKGVHRREEYKRKRMMLEQQSIAVDATKKIRFAAQTLYMKSTEFKQNQPDDLSASMIIPHKHISAEEETDETKEVAQILVTLAHSFCTDSTVHVSSSASIAKHFVCTASNKVFSSYHALGGHMSIHNNKPTKNSSLEDGGAGSSSDGREESTLKYACDKCNKKFPTGQILGGHKRGHWWKEYYYKKARLEDRKVKTLLPILPHHEAETSGLLVVPTNENIQPVGTGLVVAADTVPMACDGVQQPQQAMNLGNEIELPVPSGVSDEGCPSRQQL